MRTPPLSRVGPSDLVLVALLAVATAAIVVVLPGHAAFGRELALHGALLVGFAALVAGAALGKVPRAVTVVASIGVVVTLYTSLGRLGFVLWGAGSTTSCRASIARCSTSITCTCPARPSRARASR
jgi:hypothetical protein